MKKIAITMAGAAFALATLGAQAGAPQAPAAKPAAKPAATAKAWTVPRTPDGKPDLQGNWTNETLTPLERPATTPNLIMTEEEAARLEKNLADRRDRLNEPSDPDRPAPPKGGDGSVGAAGNVGGYNNFWLAPGERVAVIDGKPRSSIVVDPPDGRVPPQTPEAQKRGRGRLAAFQGRGQYDHPEMRPLAERCIVSFGSNAGPPMLPNGFYNNNYTIVQTKDHVMILTEMVHDTRIIRIGGERQPTQIRPWFGESIGRWEGDTLVVETTNFHPSQVFRGASENLKVTERFTRAGPDTILYRFTIDDPTTFTKPWTGELPFTRMDELIYEYACHEGNYALSNVLSGERNREQREAERKKSQQQQ
jgi:hypothetical protein